MNRLTGQRLKGKVALISGASRGMGASHARAVVEEGGMVVIADILDEEGEQLSSALGAAATFAHLDVTSPDDWRTAVARALDRFGALNVLVNNAGMVNSAPIDAYSLDQWNDVIAVNLTGAFIGIRAAMEALKSTAPSSIVNVSSTAGLRGYANLAGYTSSKFGVTGLTNAAALDLGVYGIRVNSIHPGVVATPMTEGMEINLDHVALGRVGLPYEVSKLVVFLASDESSYCTGGQFTVDGGDTAGLAGPRKG